MIDPTIQPRPVHLERQGHPDDPAPVLLHVLDRGPAGEVRIQIKSFWGRPFVDVRLYRRRRGATTAKATSSGITIGLDELAAVVRALEAAAAAAPVGNAGRGRP